MWPIPENMQNATAKMQYFKTMFMLLHDQQYRSCTNTLESWIKRLTTSKF